jgi:MOSC domain-containing protein YiiM
MNPRVVAVCVGRAEPIGPARRGATAQPNGVARARDAAPGADGGQTRSAIRKQPVSTLADPRRIDVAADGLWGDEQADLSLHGGPLRAVYMYPAAHYAFWATVREQARLPAALPFGALGENLTVEGLRETDLWIGDVLAIGQTRLAVTSPRTPCWKLDAAMGFSWASRMMVQSGFTGWYLSVVRQGTVAAGDEVLVRPGDRVLSVRDRHAMRHPDRQQSLF